MTWTTMSRSVVRSEGSHVINLSEKAGSDTQIRRGHVGGGEISQQGFPAAIEEQVPTARASGLQDLTRIPDLTEISKAFRPRVVRVAHGENTVGP